mgnify:CR=1 FL=1|jgi:hypothetical protein
MTPSNGKARNFELDTAFLNNLTELLNNLTTTIDKSLKGRWPDEAILADYTDRLTRLSDKSQNFPPPFTGSTELYQLLASETSGHGLFGVIERLADANKHGLADTLGNILDGPLSPAGGLQTYDYFGLRKLEKAIKDFRLAINKPFQRSDSKSQQEM